MIRAICPGSFDPITNGHLDIIERASKMFSEVVVVVMTNYQKKGHYAFSEDERVALIKKATSHLENVRVDCYDGLLADYANKNDIKVVVKGLRALSDFDSEFQQALGNNKLNPELETVFIATRAENMYLSSSLVRQIAEYGGNFADFVPASVFGDIKNHYRKD
ncbi:MAG: pantetheine-phosphate adenylyltransferase [Oscillospiraceae bacterium]|nr:pantetheine-phosphate adenylyltransferase [Candidatus Limimonas coprohippi]